MVLAAVPAMFRKGRNHFVGNKSIYLSEKGLLRRPSGHIRARQTREMLRAARHSYHTGRPLNHHVTVDFGWPSPGDEIRPYRLWQALRKKVWSWWDYQRRKGRVTGPFVDWVSWEAPGGKHHANWLIAVPEDLRGDLVAVIERRAHKVMPCQPDTVHQQEVWNLNGIAFYSLKGTEPAYARKIDIEPTPQGDVWFRRASAARALGPAARERDWSAGRISTLPTPGLLKPREARQLGL